MSSVDSSGKDEHSDDVDPNMGLNLALGNKFHKVRIQLLVGDWRKRIWFLNPNSPVSDSSR